MLLVIAGCFIVTIGACLAVLDAQLFDYYVSKAVKKWVKKKRRILRLMDGLESGELLDHWDANPTAIKYGVDKFNKPAWLWWAGDHYEAAYSLRTALAAHRAANVSHPPEGKINCRLRS